MNKKVFLIIIFIILSYFAFSQITFIANFVDYKETAVKEGWVTLDMIRQEGEELIAEAKAEIINGQVKIELEIDTSDEIEAILRLTVYNIYDMPLRPPGTPPSSQSSPFFRSHLQCPPSSCILSRTRRTLQVLDFYLSHALSLVLGGKTLVPPHSNCLLLISLLSF